MSDCIFCDIVSGSGSASLVYENDTVLAFLDIRPLSRGHTLIIPKAHAANLAELEPSDGAAMFAAGQLIAAAMRRSELEADGVNLLVNDGRAAMQTVFHSHLHVVPRRNGDKIKFVAQLLTRRPHELDATAALIRAAL